MTFETLQIIPYLVLFTAVTFVWLPNLRNKWLLVCGIANILAFVFGIIHFMGILANICLVSVVYIFNDYKGHKKLLPGIGLFLIAIFFITHNVPGISNVLIAKTIKYDSSIPFDLYINFDKTLLGLLIIGFANIVLVRSWQEYKNLIASIKFEILIVAVILIIMALITGFIRFSPKIPGESLLWLLHNLFTTCLAEEAFFRVFIQNSLFAIIAANYHREPRLNQVLEYIFKFCGQDFIQIKNQYPKIESAIIAILLTSVFFGICHYKGGLSFIILSTLAGIFYGWSYFKTSRIEAAITIHFLVNTLHFFLFTYPMYLEG